MRLHCPTNISSKARNALKLLDTARAHETPSAYAGVIRSVGCCLQFIQSVAAFEFRRTLPTIQTACPCVLDMCQGLLKQNETKQHEVRYDTNGTTEAPVTALK